jgi:hypothetical protein
LDHVPDPLLLRKSGSAGIRTRDLCICSQKLTQHTKDQLQLSTPMYFSNKHPGSTSSQNSVSHFAIRVTKFVNCWFLYSDTNVAGLPSFPDDKPVTSTCCAILARGFPWTSPSWRPFLPVLSKFVFLPVFLQCGFRKLSFFPPMCEWQHPVSLVRIYADTSRSSNN